MLFANKYYAEDCTDDDRNTRHSRYQKPYVDGPWSRTLSDLASGLINLNATSSSLRCS